MDRSQCQEVASQKIYSACEGQLQAKRCKLANKKGAHTRSRTERATKFVRRLHHDDREVLLGQEARNADKIDQ